MPIKRCPSQLQVPPPSPIPKATGSRSAANDRFTEFLDKSLHCPELTLPESHFPAMAHTLVPAEIDYRSLSSPAINRLVRSAKEFGAFRISGHGISAQELGRVEEEAERVMVRAAGSNANSRWTNPAVERNCRGEMIPCVQSRKGTLQFIASKFFGFKSHRNFWIHMGNIASKLDSIVEKVSVALEEHKSERFKEQIQETETVICLCRYPHGNAGERDHEASSSSSSSSSNERLHDHALRFYLPMEHCIFYIQSGRGPLSFDAGPDTIVVTVGKQLELARRSSNSFHSFILFSTIISTIDSLKSLSGFLDLFTIAKLSQFLLLCIDLLAAADGDDDDALLPRPRSGNSVSAEVSNGDDE
ncbi:putative downstream target of AGL15-4 protein [Senna tora]|uniref:Putative downstream target of AGL15-4 protein n=1 Tax=Senna tora TaxID=362788 RepID=A0A834XGS6_9FABA|nr:putative downstream target of AGL15-4 protein [Senna tora]